jgi:alpha-glucosidase
LRYCFEHVSNQHPWFKAALNGDQSYRSRFSFNEDGSYQCWWGYAGLPELNLADLFVQQYLFAGEADVLQFWINKGFDGIRLDCANDLSLPVCEKIAAIFRQRFPDAALIGEVANFALPWLQALDAAQSYFFTASLKALMAGSINTRQLQRNLVAALGSGSANQFLMLSSHDSKRTNTDFAGDKKKISTARRLQFTLPGIPMIYYGEEFGLKGGADPDNRAGMPWKKRMSVADRKFGDEIRYLARLRQNSPELRHGIWQPVITDLHPDLFAFFRACENQPDRFTLVTWNNSEKQCSATITVPWGWLFSETKLHEVFSEKVATASAGLVYIQLEPGECAIWQLRDGSKKNYSFYKKFS